MPQPEISPREYWRNCVAMQAIWPIEHGRRSRRGWRGPFWWSGLVAPICRGELYPALHADNRLPLVDPTRRQDSRILKSAEESYASVAAETASPAK